MYKGVGMTGRGYTKERRPNSLENQYSKSVFIQV